MRLKILACRQVYSGKNGRGDEYTIYEIDAANMQGSTINEKLRSFSALPIGQDIDVTVTLFNSEQHGKSFTLHPRDRARTSSTARLNELWEVVEAQKGMIAALSDRVTALEGASPANGAPKEKALQPNSDQLDSSFGSDAPW